MAYDSYVYFEGKATNANLEVKGETTDTTFKAKNAFEIYSFSWGASNPVTISSAKTGAGAGKVSISSFNLMKKTDGASPTLFQACCLGAHFPKVVVTLRKAGGKQEKFIEYTFETCFIESVQWSGSSGGDDTPTESLSIAFGKVTGLYYAQTATGTMATTPSSFNYDVEANVHT
jgi:type VI secretion system secreted protein Hcp